MKAIMIKTVFRALLYECAKFNWKIENQEREKEERMEGGEIKIFYRVEHFPQFAIQREFQTLCSCLSVIYPRPPSNKSGIQRE